MKSRTGVCAACVMVAGMMSLVGCASAPAPEKGAAAPDTMMDVSQVPGLESTLYISESASVARPRELAPTPEELASAAMQQQTQGMAPGAVAGGPKDQVVIHIPESAAPVTGGARPMLAIPALQPKAESLPPEEGESWKKPLPPLRSLEGR